MSVFNKLAGAVLAVGAFGAATPASAAITTFAQYQAIGTGANMYFKNSGASGASGLGGSLYTISSANSKVAGARNVSFSFLQPSIAPYVTDIVASFSLNAVTTSIAMQAGGFLVQPGISGTFSFLSTTAITIGTTTFGVGSNLLSGTFNQAAIIGARNASSGAIASSTTGGATITYTSDFLSFAPTVDRDFALSLTAITSTLNAVPSTGVPTKALRTFKALSTGSFSTDPAPIVTAVPEPAVWGLMIVGFGMVGLQSRRRIRRNATTTA